MTDNRPNPPTNDPSIPGPTFVRYGVSAFLALAACSAYISRNCIAVVNTTMQKDLGINDEEMGWVLGAFSAGYFVCQIPGGWLGNKIGTRGAFSLISTLWSLCILWTSTVVSYVPLVASRVSYGLAQAGMVPISAQIINDWFSVRSRGSYSAVIGAAMSIGAVISMGLTGFSVSVVNRMYNAETGE